MARATLGMGDKAHRTIYAIAALLVKDETIIKQMVRPRLREKRHIFGPIWHEALQMARTSPRCPKM